MIFDTSDILPLVNVTSEDASLVAAANVPVFTSCVWLQLGFGRLIAGGNVYGNADCGTDWWYRNAVLIVEKEPSRWQRRKWLFLAGLRGTESMQRLHSVFDVFEQVALFL